MKFAKYLESNLVPEWRQKYLDYKRGKKLLHKVERARRAAEDGNANGNGYRIVPTTSAEPVPSSTSNDANHEGDNNHTVSETISSIPIPQGPQTAHITSRGDVVVGSLTCVTPPHEEDLVARVRGLQQLHEHTDERRQSEETALPEYHARDYGLTPRSVQFPRPERVRRAGHVRPQASGSSDEDGRLGDGGGDEDGLWFNPEQREFQRWLDGEFFKITSFCTERENEARGKFKIIREQLHEMRDQKIRNQGWPSLSLGRAKQGEGEGGWRKGLRKRVMDKPLDNILNGPLNGQGTMPNGAIDRLRSHTSQPEADLKAVAKEADHVQYRYAKRKLRAAVLEHYRGLELIRSYRTLNREAFRKILKKFDKTAGVRASRSYLAKVDDSVLGQGEELERMMAECEDVFSRYFERGDRKAALDRLRSHERQTEHPVTMFRVGMYLGMSAVFLVQGIYLSQQAETRARIPQTVSLLQIWAGFGLPILFLLLFGINCWAWRKARINYPFIFEFDGRHMLIWQTFFELPSILALLWSVFFWLNFENYWPDQLPAIWYPIFFLGLALVLMLNPFDFGYRSSRKWFGVAAFRLLCSGLYPVEFRDFFLGDQVQSLTYSMGNIELFACLYARHWKGNLQQCNSAHSALLGFMTCLPGIWRFLQCLRRYRDTRNVFPHLVNAGKYLCTTFTYMFLSLWRIHLDTKYQVLYIVFATLNTIYTSLWDLFMDWSLLQPHAPHRFLRHDLGFGKVWLYYFAIVADPIMRVLGWIFYPAFPAQIQHSATVSFVHAIVEVFRRFMWNFFRMENEHMTNVGKFRAQRDIPLPYHLYSQSDEERPGMGERTRIMSGLSASGSASGSDQPLTPLGKAAPAPVGQAFRRLATATNMFKNVHAQDFQRRTEEEASRSLPSEGSDGDLEEDEEEDDDHVIVGSDADVEDLRGRNRELREEGRQGGTGGDARGGSGQDGIGMGSRRRGPDENNGA
ncbi:hypothetical protein G7K_3321-t1 [Saitoella complicata NRRL Y-17804]|uniref:SPX domain-containing protein n=2 Tax=Saitoella complicata (strain BCRC 22490 / CBS 7301 / JCM 7358 / NBRC 10748 / NRRL Y-17804) TaxID=698492 RepID=A0A0E9NH76_SAICN|nr:hypothetical protein G7K_3321-t1 [Saitoella complicata NRRL Y-17804]